MTKNDLIRCDVCGTTDEVIIENIKGQITCDPCETKRTIKQKQYKGGMSKYDTAQELEEMLDDVRPPKLTT